MYQSMTWYKDVPVKVQEYMMYANLIVIDMTDWCHSRYVLVIDSPYGNQLSEETCVLLAAESEVLRVSRTTSEVSCLDDSIFESKKVA